MSYKFAIGVQDTPASAVYINGLTAVSASVVSGSDFKGKWTGEAIPNSYISDLAASKLSGQLANARVAEANVTQHQAAITAVGVLTGLRVAADGYSNFGTTAGTSGYGFRDDDGDIQFKNSGGSWTDLAVGADLAANNTLGATSSHLHQITGTLAVSGSAQSTPSLYVSSAEPAKIKVGIGTNSPSYPLDCAGSARFQAAVIVNRRTKTANYTLAKDDYIIGVDTSGGAFTIALPDASTLSAGQLFVIKDERGRAATNNLTISASTDGQSIDGNNTIVLDADSAALSVYTNGSNAYFIY